MPAEISCPIWGEDHKATLHSQWVRNEFVIMDEDLIDSPRAGGLYRLTEGAFARIHNAKLTNKQRAILTTWLFDQRENGVRSPVITTGVFESIAFGDSIPILSRHERGQKLLKFLVDKTEGEGNQVLVGKYGDTALIVSESEDWMGVFFLLRYLNEQGFIEYKDTRNPSECRPTVTMEGFDHAERSKLSSPINNGASMHSPSHQSQSNDSTKILVVHGHDNESKQEVARLIEKQDLEAVILEEQPSRGRTLIDKFMQEASEVNFAVVLLTPDDEGRKQGTEEKLRPRARQNVILELGFVSASLGPHRVCALLKGEVEIPSDYEGVVYVPMNNNDWKRLLIKELDAAGYHVDANKI